jgi:glycosyltransferase involved in cell wall biosynthesis
MLMEAVAYRRSQYFMACSGPLRQHLACRGFDPEKIVVIRNGVDTRLFKPCCCSTNNENFMVTYAGSFQKWQGIDNLLEAAELLPESNIKFKIVGFKDPILKSKIKKRLKGNGILIDDVPQFELVKHLCESDILQNSLNIVQLGNLSLLRKLTKLRISWNIMTAVLFVNQPLNQLQEP